MLETARLSSPAAAPYELGSGGVPPAWSPDGRKIAFLGMGDDGNVDVYVVGADGLGQQRLTRHPGVDGNPAWSPDGRKIAFTRRAREWGAGKTYIYVMNADGSGQRRLSHGHVHFSVAWSPDGRKMLFERPNPRHPHGPVPGETAEDLHVMNADGSGQRNLTRNPARDNDSGLVTRRAPDCLRRGARRLGDEPRRQRPTESDTGGSLVVRLFGLVARRAEDRVHETRQRAGRRKGPHLRHERRWQRAAKAHATWRSPAWSPDGGKIAFDGGQRYRLDRTRPHGIFVMNADGSERRRLTQRGEGPAWSPDGKMIAFDRPVATGEELIVMTADGSRRRRLMRTEGGVLTQGFLPFAWSPTQK